MGYISSQYGLHYGIGYNTLCMTPPTNVGMTVFSMQDLHFYVLSKTKTSLLPVHGLVKR